MVGDNPTCSICDKPLDLAQPCVGTTHFIEDEKHPLWKYSDTVMHRECFLSWKHRSEFVSLHNAVFTPRPGIETVSLHLSLDGEVFRKHYPSGKLYPQGAHLNVIQQDQRLKTPTSPTESQESGTAG